MVQLVKNNRIMCSMSTLRPDSTKMYDLNTNLSCCVLYYSLEVNSHVYESSVHQIDTWAKWIIFILLTWLNLNLLTIVLYCMYDCTWPLWFSGSTPFWKTIHNTCHREWTSVNIAYWKQRWSCHACTQGKVTD